jgi:hypothetical protein
MYDGGHNQRVAAFPPFPPKNQNAPPPGAPTKRNIPTDHPFQPKALKPMSKALYACSVALGNALAAYREFSRIKSATVSPDGLLGGRGYVMGVRDMRQKMWDSCEALSAVVDTLHDEISAPHWKPKLAQLDENDAEDVSRFVEESEEILENPEGEAEEKLDEIEQANDKKKPKGKEPASETPTGGDQEAEGEAQPPSTQVKEASVRQAGGLELDVGMLEQQLFSMVKQLKKGENVPVPPITDTLLEEVGRILRNVRRNAALPFEVQGYLGEIHTFLNQIKRHPDRPPIPFFNRAWQSAHQLNVLFSGIRTAACEGGCGCGGPRVDHLEPERGPGPWGMFNEDEEPSDNWQDDMGDYDFTSEWENETAVTAAARGGEWIGEDEIAAWSDVLGWLAVRDFRRNDTEVEAYDQYGRAYHFPVEEVRLYWPRDYGHPKKANVASEADVWAQSVMPDESMDDTDTEAWDFGLGFGARGQGAGNYANPSDEGNGKGIWGPHSGLPGAPNQSTGDTSTQVDEAINRLATKEEVDAWIQQGIAAFGSRMAFLSSDEYRLAYNHIAKVYGVSLTPGDVAGTPARSDYYPGPKSDNLVQADADAWAESVLPGEAPAGVDYEVVDESDALYVHEDTATPYNAYDYKTDWPAQDKPDEQPFSQDGEATR